MLLVELARTAPYYSVILVPSLFPQNADNAWGGEGRREGTVKTNGNFPKLSESAVSYKDGKARHWMPRVRPYRQRPYP